MTPTSPERAGDGAIGTREASVLLAFLAPAALGGAVAVAGFLDLHDIADDPALLVSTLLGAIALTVLMWHVLCLCTAVMATATVLPAQIAGVLVRLLTRIGTARARELLARRGATTLLGTGLALGLGSAATASPWLTPAPSSSTPAVVGDPSPPPSADPLAGLPQDLSWGADASAGPSARHTTTWSMTSTSASATVHVVAPGESLWTIASQHLGPDATADEVARLWPRIHAANHEAIGPDPDLIHPGTELTIPRERS